MVILGQTKLKDALDAYPEIKETLIALSPKFEKLNNKLIFSTVGRFASFNDIAKMGGLSICEILHTINGQTGNVGELERVFPECIKAAPEIKKTEPDPDWMDSVKQFIVMDVRHRNDFFFTDIIKRLKELKEGNALQVINSFYPAPIIGMLEEEGYELYVETKSAEEFRLNIRYKAEPEPFDWRDKKEEFEEFDVRSSKEDPFGAIIKKAGETPEGSGFKLVQKFEPIPLINMLEPMGFEYETVEIGYFEFHVYFYKVREIVKKKRDKSDDRIPVVIQAATPVVVPIIMRLLKSERLMNAIRIDELKIWKETEKHMAWVANGKADITFSAIAAAAKLYLTGNDLKMASVDIWDNFYLLTRDYKASTFADLKGHEIYVPLYKEAPPYAITSYLMKQKGENPDDYSFNFGNPFGRPEVFQEQFIKGEIDTVLLREPEASFALHGAGDAAMVAISYADIWNEIHPGSGMLPNAGLIFKGEFAREHPDAVKLLMEELKIAVDYINENPKDTANQSYDLMGGSVEGLELFLERVTYKHEASENVIEPIMEYLRVLGDSKAFSYIGENEEVRDMFGV
ncbi:MAG: DUF2249 domain-containing protein [Spirochaetota bacterium]|nr:DUF2249 domain-containing protein [Spirochaetota bacterium]